MNTVHLRYKDQTRRERTWTIHFISLEKVIKGTLLIVVAFRLLSLFDRDVHAWAAEFVTRHGFDIANRYIAAALERLVGMGNTQLVEASVIALVYAGLLYTEGIGLWLQKRWAEYMTTYLTALFIPFEIYELYERFTWVRIAILALNIFIVWYLSTRLKDEKIEDAKTKVKICGITNSDDALLAVKFGADELGFNFYEKSPRYVTPSTAASIISELPGDVWKVGVFVNESAARICEIAEVVGLDAIQLHGDEDNSFIEEIHTMSDLPVIKALRISPDFTPDDATRWSADAVLLDKYSPKERGGTGEVFDWTIAGEISTIVARLYLAGGLTAENVADAIRTVRPYAVDACSRLESSPGKKDPKKVEAFIKAAKEAI